MTEIPEHLLQRSRERRAALGLGGGDGGDAPADAAGTAVEAVAATTPAAAAPSAPAIPEPEPEPIPDAPYVTAAKTRKKIPIWAAPVLLGLIPWTIAYVGTLERPAEGLTGIRGEGEVLYEEAGCAGCHGAGGGGGQGPRLSGGEVQLTFPRMEDQVVWIARGTSGFSAGENYASPGGRERPAGSNGNMPGFGEGTGHSIQLDAEELLAVTIYERTEFEEGPSVEADIETAEILGELIEAGEIELPEEVEAEGLTAETVMEWLEPVREALAEEEG